MAHTHCSKHTHTHILRVLPTLRNPQCGITPTVQLETHFQFELYVQFFSSLLLCLRGLSFLIRLGLIVPSFHVGSILTQKPWQTSWSCSRLGSVLKVETGCHSAEVIRFTQPKQREVNVNVWKCFFSRTFGNGGSHDVHPGLPNHGQSRTWGLETAHLGLWLVLLVSVFPWHYAPSMILNHLVQWEFLLT